MPSIFFREAYEAVCSDPRILRKLRDEHFQEFKLLEEALSWLKPEARCDAIHANWLLVLDTPLSNMLLQARNRLIKQGGLAANYLAEFAQNADDALERTQGGEVRIWTRSDWLLVANNGRRFTGLDLFGLCSFFSNGAKQIEPDSIGKFGVGFKSCYRIGSEVWVKTWGDGESFGFRLPLCRNGLPESYYDVARFEKLIRLLKLAAPRMSQDELGYCTPEFSLTPPPEIADQFREVEQAFESSGSIFAIRLHAEGRASLAERLKDQASQVYELCPLFLRKLRITRLELTSLRLIQHEAKTTDSIVDFVTAEPVTLEAQTADGRKSNARFWRLTEAATSNPWKIALHADSNFLLSVSTQAGEFLSLREGAAYAFFPLSTVTANWPFRLHLHLDCPTDLSRNNWSPENPEEIRSRIRAAAAGLCQWLEANPSKWHDEWDLSAIIKEIPPRPLPGAFDQQPAWWFFDELQSQVQKRDLLRSLTGHFTSGGKARGVPLYQDAVYLEGWRELGQQAPEHFASRLWCNENCVKVWNVPQVQSDDIIELIKELMSIQEGDILTRDQMAMSLLKCVLGINLGRRSSLEEWLRHIRIPSADCTVMELFERPGGATLSSEWHRLFQTLHAALKDAESGERAVAKSQLIDRLKRFSRAAFNPPWSDVPTLLRDYLWPDKGDEFWGGSREACPANLVRPVVAILEVRNAAQDFRPIAEVWLASSTAPTAFEGAVANAHSKMRLEYKTALTNWGLFEEYDRVLQERLAQDLPAALGASLKQAVAHNRVGEWIEKRLGEKQQADKDGLQWGALFGQALSASIVASLVPALRDLGPRQILSRSIPDAVRSVVLILRDYVEAPTWLNDRAFESLVKADNGGIFSGLTFLPERSFTTKFPDITRQLLVTFHSWKSRPLSSAQCEALEKIFASPSRTDRKNFPVGIGPRTARPLSDFIVIEESESDPNSYWLKEARTVEATTLPGELARFPALVEVCARIKDLKLVMDGLPESGLSFLEHEVADEILALPPVQKLLRDGGVTSIHQHVPLKLEWRDGERRVASVDRADFVVRGQQLFVSRIKISTEDQQFEDILSNYLSHSAQDPEVTQARTEARESRTPIRAVYERFRPRIFKQLCRAFIEDVGYSPEHIWRELLQNAENAYASLPDPRPIDQPFSVTVLETTDNHCLMTVTNHGRRFNQADRDGNPRDDIARIISVGGQRVQTRMEIGRYNLGFKSVFSITDTVEITSGTLNFSVKDLLLRYPSKPIQRPEKAAEPTSFSWKCSKRDAAVAAGVPVNATQGASRFLRPHQTVFTRFVNKLELDYRGLARSVHITRDPVPGGTMVRFHDLNPAPVQFLVLRDEIAIRNTSEGRLEFAVAAQVDDHGLPLPIPDEQCFFHVVFPTEHKSFVPFLIDADFEMHGQSRGQIQDCTRNLTLINAAARLLFEHAQEMFARDVSKSAWIAWARILAPDELLAGAKIFFSEGLSATQALRDEICEFLLAHVPHGGRSVCHESLTMPSALLRRFASEPGKGYDFSDRNWIEPEVEVAMRKLGVNSNYTLGEWVSHLDADDDTLRQLRDELDSFQLKSIEIEEMRRARDVVARRVQQPVAPPPSWGIDSVATWWEENCDETPFTLDGDLFTWVAPATAQTPGDRRAALVGWLSDPTSAPGREVWYRMLSYACFVSVGNRHTEVVKFETLLASKGFFARTATEGFSSVAEELFLQLTKTPFTGGNATGELADFWRRLFYDVKKVHHLIYENDFGEVLLGLCRREDRADAIIPFLRSGQLPGQSHWRGVLGQSALSPLFFVIRELRRLGLIEHPAADDTAFFVCRPVRRTARRLGWISEEEELRGDQDSLLVVAAKIHERFKSSPLARQHLLPYFDIPLLALDQSGELEKFA
ncbi:MAG: hypothetical protein IT285_06155 [Bdellovibrionales bacterium]|nr:hypothetical protein [Opitutaceae bacterium]MCC7441193.1 hypothetical protein [Bdellovibrionales bacterium]